MSGGARVAAALAAGLLFGLGLALSGMLDPARVRGFLDIGGAWDPSLVFVLGGAVSVSALGYGLSRRLPHPALAGTFDLPTSRRIDAPFVLGAALFGIGWGLSGFCPARPSPRSRPARPRSSSSWRRCCWAWRRTDCAPEDAVRASSAEVVAGSARKNAAKAGI